MAILTSKEFLSRQYFLNNSNIKNPLINNIFHLDIIGENENLISSKVLENLETKQFEDVNIDLIKKNDHIFNILQQNSFSVTMSTVESEFTTQYVNNIRNYNFYKRADDKITVSFVESDSLIIRTIFEQWMNLTLPYDKNSLYTDDVGMEFVISPLNTNLQKNKKVIYEGVIPTSVNEISLNLGEDVVIQLLQVIFVFKKIGEQDDYRRNRSFHKWKWNCKI